VAARSSGARRRLAGLTAATILGVCAAIGFGAPAAAHPLGTPQSVRLGAEDRQVWLRWTAAADDLSALGIHLGVLGDDRTLVDDQGVLVPEQSAAYDAVRLARTQELSRYLLQHIAVDQSGRPCPGRVTDTRELTGEGARLVFSCPEAVDDVMIRVDTLTDVDPAYRTLAASDNGERATYTIDAPEHRWELDRAVGLGGYPVGFWVTGLGLLAVVVPGATVLLLRRLRAADPSAADPSAADPSTGR
jgi:hypothetical protein